MIWLKWFGIAVGVMLLIIVSLGAFGAARWSDRTRRLNARLEAARLTIRPARYDAQRELGGLPAPVQRWFRNVLTDGQPMVAAATVEHRGSFNMGGSGDQWKLFTSRQRVVTRRPGFVWDGKVAVFPGLDVRVHDAYVAGLGILHPAILGLFTLVDLRGTREVAEGELMRFFAEAAWYPTALLPSQGVLWQPLDGRSARATLTDGDLSLTLTFTFAEDGMLQLARADARGRTVAGKIVMTPWEGRWSDVQVREGMKVPLTGEVAWLTAEGRRPYWRGTMTSVRYEFAP